MKPILLTLALLAASVAIGGGIAAVNAKYVSRITPGGMCTPADYSEQAQTTCNVVRAGKQVYGWPVDARSRSVAPSLPTAMYTIKDVDYRIPVIDMLVDGIFANWAFYTAISFIVLAVPYGILLKRWHDSPASR